tara:strand:+ start:45 stop:491 length:447 start_codon:yes stop_codon:yes gene_type:complete
MVSNTIQKRQKEINTLTQITNEMKQLKKDFHNSIRRLVKTQIDRLKKRDKLQGEATRLLYSINTSATTINQVKNNEKKLKKYKNTKKKILFLNSQIIEIGKDMDDLYKKKKNVETHMKKIKEEVYNKPISKFISRHIRRNENENGNRR